jgi:hypothetical protein
MFQQNHLLGGALAVLLPLCANAFYLPDAAPHDYALGEKVNVFVNALTSIEGSKLVRSLNDKEEG